MDHAKWLESQLKVSLNPFQAKVADILGMVGSGLYNAPINPEKIQLFEKYFVVTWRGQLATWDFDQLTRLVLLCHVARIRCCIEGCGPNMIRFYFSPRVDTGDIAVRHPDISEMLDRFREYLPRDHRVRYENLLVDNCT
jgi:hypothetical protein